MNHKFYAYKSKKQIIVHIALHQFGVLPED